MNATARLLTLALACAGSSIATGPVSAANETTDCSNANAMMMHSTMHDSMTTDRTNASSADVDGSFRSMMIAHDGAAMKLAKIEVACGKNPKTVAAAKELLTDAEARMQLFRNQGTSN